MIFAEALAALMAERGISCSALARQVPCDRALISRYLSAKQQPSARMARRVDEVLCAGGKLASLAAGQGTRPSHASEAQVSHESNWPEPWELADALTGSSVSMAALDHMERAVTGFAACYPSTPPWDLAPPVQVMLRRAKDILDHSQPIKVRVRCIRLVGVLCGVAGQLADDTGRHYQAKGYFDAGEIAGAEIGDGDLIAWILATRSIGSFFRGEYASVGDLLSRAQAAANCSTARRQAWLAALSARASAASSSNARASNVTRRGVMISLDRAFTQMSLAAEPPRDTDFFDLPRLAGMAGTTLLLLRDTGQAKKLLGDALARRSPADAKGRALLTLDLAECSAVDDEPDRASRLAADALDMVHDSAVRPVLVRTRAIREILQPWKDVKAVRDLGVRLAEIASPGTEG